MTGKSSKELVTHRNDHITAKHVHPFQRCKPIECVGWNLSDFVAVQVTMMTERQHPKSTLVVATHTNRAVSITSMLQE